MKTILRSLICAGVLAIGSLGLGASRADAQGFGFSYASPGLAIGVGNPGFVPGAYPAYPVVPGPVVVAPPPVVVGGGYYYGRPGYYGRPAYYGRPGYYGHPGYYGRPGPYYRR